MQVRDLKHGMPSLSLKLVARSKRLPVSVGHEWIPGPPNWRDMGDGPRCVPECSIGIIQPNVAGQGVIGTKEKEAI